ncbi:hypothetical protein [Arthrobacter methylotrophus]|uniref:hypothetical protein n=1 Tax=Arthrobacter methylotrophus TaxID=121291 RepID=UPI0031EC7F25
MSGAHTGQNHLHAMWATRLLTLAANSREADMRPHRLPQCLLSALTLSLALAGPARAAPEPEPVDILIRNGTVVDGSGGAPFVADVGIRNDRIVLVQPSATGVPAKRCSTRAGWWWRRLYRSAYARLSQPRLQRPAPEPAVPAAGRDDGGHWQ